MGRHPICAKNQLQMDHILRRRGIMKEISRGRTRSQIEEWYQKKYPELSEKTMKSDLQEAFDQIVSKQEVFNNNIRELLSERYDILWEMALNKQDIKTCTTILKQMADVFGATVQKQEITVKTEEPIEIIFE